MKVDFSLELRTMAGEPIPRSKTNQAATTLKDVAVEALLAFDPQKNVKGKDKMQRWQIAATIYASNGEVVTMEMEDVAKIKELVGDIYGPLIVGQAWNMLEGDAVEDDAEEASAETE